MSSNCSSLSRSHHEGQDPAAQGGESPPPETADQKLERFSQQQKELQNSLNQANSKIEALEIRIGSLNDKLDATRSSVDSLISNQQVRREAVLPKTDDLRGSPIPTTMASSDPEAGFKSDESIQRYRKAMVLFDSKNYSDAVLAFSTFMDQFPDHALAGSAQFFLAESYFQQGEYKLAAREYQRVLTTYDRSPKVPEALARLATCEDRMQQPQAASGHRELLAKLFPASPAAARMRSSKIEGAQPPGSAVSPPTESGLDSPPPTAPAPASPALAAPPNPAAAPESGATSPKLDEK